MNIPEYKRMVVLNHYINEEGEGEPSDREEILVENYDKK
jgi:hypothetical protein